MTTYTTARPDAPYRWTPENIARLALRLDALERNVRTIQHLVAALEMDVPSTIPDRLSTAGGASE